MKNLQINKLRNSLGYEFECNMCEEFSSYDYYDEFGCAFIWYKRYGVEYNFSVTPNSNCCAIYPITINYLTYENTYITLDGWSRHTHQPYHYEIDFSNKNWKKDLEKEMCKVMIDYFGNKFY